MKKTIKDFLKKKGREKIVMITAYDYPTARIISETDIDSILVGDSLGMVVLGYSSTLPVKMSEIMHHLKAVVRANPPQLIIADMPFMSYEISIEKALYNAGRLIKLGADAVKIEGGAEMANTVRALVKAGIPVMGHIGLTPQRYLQIGGYKMMGKDEEKLINDALELENAGAFSIVIENTYADVARKITEKLSIPTIGIGSGPYCDGQILVIHDLLGLSETIPYFAKSYVDLKGIIKEALKKYVEDVKSMNFPSKNHYKTLEES